MNEDGLTSMIFDDEYFATSFIRTLEVKRYYIVIIQKKTS